MLQGSVSVDIHIVRHFELPFPFSLIMRRMADKIRIEYGIIWNVRNGYCIRSKLAVSSQIPVSAAAAYLSLNDQICTLYLT